MTLVTLGKKKSNNKLEGKKKNEIVIILEIYVLLCETAGVRFSTTCAWHTACVEGHLIALPDVLESEK